MFVIRIKLLNAYTFTGEYRNHPIHRRGYIEYIDVENQKAFKE